MFLKVNDLKDTVRALLNLIIQSARPKKIVFLVQSCLVNASKTKNLPPETSDAIKLLYASLQLNKIYCKDQLGYQNFGRSEERKQQTIRKEAFRFFKEFNDFGDNPLMLYFDLTYD